MATKRTPKRASPRLPIDIPLPENTLLPGGAVFVRLRTLVELERFWAENGEHFPFAAQGILYGQRQAFLNEYEWVFAPSKAAVVSTALRWEQFGIECRWFDWADSNPDDHTRYFADRESYRARRIEAGTWSADDEAEFSTRTPENYRGYWVLDGLPEGFTFADWFGPFQDTEIIDPSLSVADATQRMQEFTFDDWGNDGEGEIEFLSADAVARQIAYWQRERETGWDYYGQENE